MGNLVGNSCGKGLWKILKENLVGNLAGNSCRKSCGKLLRENLVGKSCGKFLWENLAGNSCGKFLQENLMRQGGGKSQFKKGSDWWKFSIWNRVMGSQPIRIQLGKILWENLVGNTAGNSPYLSPNHF